MDDLTRRDNGNPPGSHGIQCVQGTEATSGSMENRTIRVQIEEHTEPRTDEGIASTHDIRKRIRQGTRYNSLTDGGNDVLGMARPGIDESLDQGTKQNHDGTTDTTSEQRTGNGRWKCNAMAIVERRSDGSPTIN
jgi:hypothetical protein